MQVKKIFNLDLKNLNSSSVVKKGSVFLDGTKDRPLPKTSVSAVLKGLLDKLTTFQVCPLLIM